MRLVRYDKRSPVTLKRLRRRRYSLNLCRSTSVDELLTEIDLVLFNCLGTKEAREQQHRVPRLHQVDSSDLHPWGGVLDCYRSAIAVPTPEPTRSTKLDSGEGSEKWVLALGKPQPLERRRQP